MNTLNGDGTLHYYNHFMFCIGALHFVLKRDDYREGIHTVLVRATDLLGENANFTLTFGILNIKSLFSTFCTTHADLHFTH